MSKEVASNGKTTYGSNGQEMDSQMNPDVRAHTDMILDVVDGTCGRMRNSSVRESNNATTSTEGEQASSDPTISPNDDGQPVKETAEKDSDASLSRRIQQQKQKLQGGAFVESQKGTTGQGQATAGSVTPVAPEQPVGRETTEGQQQASAGGYGSNGSNNATTEPESQTHIPFPENVAMARAISETDLENEMRDRIMGSAVVAEEHKERRGIMTKSSIGLVVVIAIIIAVVLATGDSSNEGGENVGIGQPTEAPTLAPVTPAPTPLPSLTEQQQDLLDYLTAISKDEGLSLRQDRTSPQFFAFWWLARSLEEDGIASSLNNEELGERYAMATLYYSTNGDTEWFRTEGWLDPNLHICDWYPGNQGPGSPAFCYEHGMEDLQLDGNNLVGSLPSELAYLSKLVRLDLSANVLTGTIPNNLFLMMTKLESLHLGSNQLSGTMPTGVGQLSYLIELDYGENGLRGDIPSEIGRLTAMQTLVSKSTPMTGPIPTEFGLLTSLKTWDSRSSRHTGELPSELGLLSNQLEVLDIRGGQFVGSVPTDLYQLTKLRTLRLIGMGLTGTMSPLLGNLSNLEVYEVLKNKFTGSLPTEFGLLSNLNFVKIDFNRLEGELPSEIGKLMQCISFYCLENRLSGQIPSEIGLMTALRQIRLHRNKFTGTIPSEIGSLDKIELFWANSNAIQGSIPSEIGFMTSMEEFRLYHNKLSGTIPDDETVWLLPKLELFAAGEQLAGTIPKTIGLATNLVELYLHNNTLTGSIPTELALLTNLRTLALSNNRLTSTLPEGLADISGLEELLIQNNNLTDTIPSVFGSWSAIELAYFDGNELVGDVPSGFCQMALTLYADCDELSCPCCTHCCNSTGNCTSTGVGNPFEEVASPFDPYPSRSGIKGNAPPPGGAPGGPPGGGGGGPPGGGGGGPPPF